MDFSVFEKIDSSYITGAAIFLGAFLMTRFLPRLMAGVPFVDPRMVHDLIQGGKDVLVIDVRSESEFHGNLGHIGSALNLEAAELSRRLDGADGQFDSLKGEPVFITCRTENRSPRAAKILKKAGFTNVSIIKSGMAGWNRQGLPVEK